MLSALAAWGAVCLLGANAVFQLALAAGAPLGHAAYGGRVELDEGRLPGPYRWASLASALVMVGLGWVVLTAGGVVGPGPLSHEVAVWICRGAAVLFGLNTLGNLAAKSRLERWGMGAVTACLVLLFGVLGFS